MSRYSIPWLHVDESADTTSKKSAASTKKSTAGFFYPPLTPPASSSARDMAEPLVPPAPNVDQPLPPHPYQVAGLYDYHPPTHTTTPNSLSTHPHPSRFTNGTVTSSSDSSGDKPTAIQNTYVTQHQHHHYHHHHSQRPPSPASPPSNSQDRGIISKLRPLILLLVFLPVPPLLSLIYLVIGHALLRRASSSLIPWSAPLLSSANAGATGGIILALPLFLLLFFILFPVPKTSPTREAHEDFFDDESHAGNSISAGKSMAYATCVILTLAVGGAAGPLGVTCLVGNSRTPDMLALDKAAIAGLVGGAVFWAAVAVFAGLGLMGKLFWHKGPVQKVDR